MIPKTIHYCWFGKGPKPAVFEKCLNSWKTYMPDFQIKEWNEENTDLDEIPFLREAYDQKKWAFVSDVVRLMAVYKEGGIYMDTDVELYCSFEEYLQYDAFFFFQNHYQIATGLGFGGCAGNSLLKKLIDDYKTSEFLVDHMREITCPVKNTAVICREIPEFVANSHTQLHQNMLFVHCEEYYSKAMHYGEFSWADEQHRKALRFAKKKHGHWKIKRIIRHPKVFYVLEKCHLGLISRAYSFLVHDFIDYGIAYWAVRCWQKLTKRG